MKKILFAAIGAVLCLSSCTTVVKTATTANLRSQIMTTTVADVQPAKERVTHTMTPSKELQRAGLQNVKNAAIRECLMKNMPEADLLVEPEFVISKRRGFFTSKITSITVSGRPAYYKNFHSLNDSVWCNPVFRGTFRSDVKKSNAGFLR